MGVASILGILEATLSRYCESSDVTEQAGSTHLLTGVNSLQLKQYWVPGRYSLLVPRTFIVRGEFDSCELL